MRSSCPVGRSQRPDLIAKQRGRRRLSSSANTLQTPDRASRTPSAAHRCLTDDDGPRYPRPAPLTHPRKQQKRLKFASGPISFSGAELGGGERRPCGRASIDGDGMQTRALRWTRTGDSVCGPACRRAYPTGSSCLSPRAAGQLGLGLGGRFRVVPADDELPVVGIEGDRGAVVDLARKERAADACLDLVGADAP